MADEITAEVVGLGVAAAAATAILGQFNGGITNVLNTFVSSTFSMSKSATSGAASLTDMGAAVGQVANLIPVFGAAFSSVLNTAISTLEKNIETQKTLSNVGATFGGSLSTLRDTANKTYLSMDQYAKVVSSSGDVLASFKGGVQEGTKAFSNVLASLQQKGSTTGNMMANLGIGFEEGATLTAQFMRGMGNMNRTGQMSADQLAKATADYAVELTGLSQLTGQSRKELAEKVNEELAEAQFQNFLNTLDPKEAAKLQEAVALEFATTGKAGADALKASAAGFPPMTKASQMFTATQEASVERQQELMNKIRDSSVDLDTFRAQSKTILANSFEGMREDQKRISTAAMAGVLAGGSELSTSISTITKNLNIAYGKSAAEIESMFKNVRLTAPQTSDATTGVGQLKDIIRTSNETLEKMQPTFDLALAAGTRISTFLNGFAGDIAKRLPGIINFVDETITHLGKSAETALGTNLSPENFKESVMKLLDSAGDIVKTGTAALFGDKNAQQKFFADLKSGWDGVMKYIKDAIPQMSNFLFGGIPGITTLPTTPGSPSSTPDRNLIEEGRDRLGNALFGEPRTSTTTPNGPGRRADGGETTPGSYLVGEEGPELVNLGTRGDVINNDNLTAMVASMTNQNGMKESIDQLNSINGQMLSAVRELVEVSKRTLTATKGLNGNLFAA
jgi:hypothetical protein